MIPTALEDYDFISVSEADTNMPSTSATEISEIVPPVPAAQRYQPFAQDYFYDLVHDRGITKRETEILRSRLKLKNVYKT